MVPNFHNRKEKTNTEIMKIAQISPLYESVPPKMYGGTERVVAYLTDALVAQGHEVTLFASGDSETSATLVPICKNSLRLDPSCIDQMAYHTIQLKAVKDRAHEFDIIHFHTDYLHFPVSEHFTTPYITTLHGRLNMPELTMIYDAFDGQPVVSISYHQRLPLPQACWVSNIYHGLPKSTLKFGKGEGGYVAFLGRISPEKRVDRAIEIAIANNKKIKIAAKVDKADQDYFEKDIKHLLEHPLVEFIGEINETQKSDFLGQAECLLFPIDWPEPFGLAMIEAMACGTPVIAFRNGSVPEVLKDGISGYIVNSIPEAIDALKLIPQLSRKAIRKEFEINFSAERMAKDYVDIYKKLIAEANGKNITPILPSQAQKRHLENGFPETFQAVSG